MARRVVRLSAHLLADRELAERYAEEWLAGVQDTPGKLIPVIRASGILLFAMPVLNYRYFDDWWACTIGLRPFVWNLQLQLRMPHSFTWGYGKEVRSARIRYNSSLSDTCRTFYVGPADRRGDALETVQCLMADPPPWATKRLVRQIQRKELPRVTKALAARGYLLLAE